MTDSVRLQGNAVNALLQEGINPSEISRSSDADFNPQARVVIMAKDGDYPEVINKHDVNFVNPQGGLGVLSSLASESSAGMSSAIQNAAGDSSKLEALYRQQDGELCDAKDHAVLDVCLAFALAHEASQSLSGSGAEKSVVEGTLTTKMLEFLNAETAADCQRIKGELDQLMTGMQGESSDKLRSFIENKLNAVQNFVSQQEGLNKAEQGLVLKKDPKAVLNVAPTQVELDDPRGVSVIRGQSLLEDETRLALIDEGSSQHYIRLEDAKNNPNCCTDALQDGIKEMSAKNLEDLKDSISGMSLRDLFNNEDKIGNAAHFELLETDKNSFESFKKDVIELKTAEFVNTLPAGLQEALGSLDTQQRVSLLTGIGFETDKLNQLCELKPGLIADYKAALTGDDTKAKAFADNLMFAVCRNEPELIQSAINLCGSLRSDKAGAAAMKARAEFSFSMLRDMETLKHYGLKDIDIKSAEDLQKYNSQKMIEINQKVLSAWLFKDHELVKVRDNMDLALTNLARLAFAADHPGTSLAVNENKAFIAAHSAETRDKLAKILQDRDPSIFTSSADAAKFERTLKISKVNPLFKAMILSVKNMDPSPEATHSRELARYALAALAHMNPQGNMVDTMSMQDLIRLAREHMAEDFAAAGFGKDVEALKFIENTEFGMVGKEQQLYLEQAEQLAQIQNSKNGAVEGETLAVNLYLMQDVLADSVSDLSKFQLARLNIDKETYDKADTETKKLILFKGLQNSQDKAGEYEYHIVADEYLKMASDPNDTKKTYSALLDQLVSGELAEAGLRLKNGLAKRQARTPEDKLEALRELSVLQDGKVKVNLKNFSSTAWFSRSDDFASLRAILNSGKDKTGNAQYQDAAAQLDALKQAFNEQLKSVPGDALGLSSAALAFKEHGRNSDVEGSIEHALAKSGLANSRLASELKSDFTTHNAAYADIKTRQQKAASTTEKLVQQSLDSSVDSKFLRVLQTAVCEITAQKLMLQSGKQLFTMYKAASDATKEEVKGALVKTLTDDFNCEAGTAELVARRIVKNYSATEFAGDLLNSCVKAVRTNFKENFILQASRMAVQLQNMAEALQDGSSLDFKVSAGGELSFDVVEELISGRLGLKLGAQASIGKNADGTFEVCIANKAGAELGISVGKDLVAELGDRKFGVEGEAGLSGGIKAEGAAHFTFPDAQSASLFLAHAIFGLADPAYANTCGAEAMAVYRMAEVNAGATLDVGIVSENNGELDKVKAQANAEVKGKSQQSTTMGSKGVTFTSRTTLRLDMKSVAKYEATGVIKKIIDKLAARYGKTNGLEEKAKEGVHHESHSKIDCRYDVNGPRGVYPLSGGSITYTVPADRSSILALCCQCKLSENQIESVLSSFYALQKSGVKMESFSLKAEVQFEKDYNLGAVAAQDCLKKMEKSGQLRFTNAAIDTTNRENKVEKEIAFSETVNANAMMSAAEHGSQEILLQA